MAGMSRSIRVGTLPVSGHIIEARSLEDHDAWELRVVTAEMRPNAKPGFLADGLDGIELAFKDADEGLQWRWPR